MLIGAHVSPSGGPAKAVERGEERGCRSIQIFNQNPRQWKGRLYTDDEVAAYHEALKGSNVEQLVIHAVYLLNCASEDPEIRDKSLAALTLALNAGAQLKAVGVVLHPGSALKNGGSAEDAVKRAGKVIKEALAESETCPLLLEDTAGAGGTLGRSFEELAALLEAAGGQKRLGVCLDSCHLFASGYDVRTREARRRHDRRVRQGRRLRAPAGAARQRLDDRRWVRTATGTSTQATARSASRA